MVSSPPSSNGTQQPASAKKPYQRPVLVRWGYLKDITQSKQTGPLVDGALKSSTNKTGRGGHYGDYWKQLPVAD